MPKIQITNKLAREVTCPVGRPRADYFDTQLTGFVLEVRATGGKTFYVRYRDQRGTQKQHKIGSAQVLSADDARRQAQKILGRVALGEDPAEQKAVLRQIPTFEEFVRERYLPFVQGYKRSWKTDDCLLRNHLLPAWGKRHLDQIVKHDVIALHHGIRASDHTPATANRVLILARYIFNLALRWEIPGITKNPTAGVPLFEENNKRERFLTKEEASHLYEGLLRSDSPMLRYIVPMLILTGARKSEVLNATWGQFDMDRRVWRIPISKSGKARHVPLSDGAMLLLKSIPRQEGCLYVFPNPDTMKPYVTIWSSWDTARKKAGMPELRIHDLRHSFASFLINSGRSLYEVQKILGHTQARTTERYAHLSEQSLIEAANAASQAVSFVGPALPAPTI